MTEYRFPPAPDPEGGLLDMYGPLVPVSITVPLLRRRYLAAHGYPPALRKAGFALIDTGATRSAVDDRVMLELEIPILDTMGTTTPHGEGLSNLYNASISFPSFEDRSFPLDGALGCYLGEAVDLPLPVLMLVGRDILRYFTLVYNGPQGIMTLQA